MCISSLNFIDFIHFVVTKLELLCYVLKPWILGWGEGYFPAFLTPENRYFEFYPNLGLKTRLRGGDR